MKDDEEEDNPFWNQLIAQTRKDMAIEYSEEDLARMREDASLDLRNFALSPRTEFFFQQLAGFVTCKKQAEFLYRTRVQTPDHELLLPEFASCGDSPTQAGEDAFVALDRVLDDARQKKPAFDRLLRKVVAKLGMEADRVVLVDGKPIVKPWGSYTVLTLANLKSEERARAKTQADYGGNAKYLCDVGRATIVCSTEHEIAVVLQALRREQCCEVVRIKNRFARPTYTGTRDVLVNLRVDDHVFELQVHQEDLLAWDVEGGQHTYYEYFREYFRGTTESYKIRMEVFDRLGDAVRTGDIATEIRSILQGSDARALQALVAITSEEGLSDFPLNLQALKRQQALLGHAVWNHEARLDGLQLMATNYQYQGNLRKALEYYKRVLKGRESYLGEHHQKTMYTRNSIGTVYTGQGKYSKALQIYRELLNDQESILGKDHKETLRTVHSMAIAYAKQRNLWYANAFFGRVLRGNEMIWGKEHQNTLIAMVCLANVLRDQGGFDKAMELYDRALKGQESTLGKDHPETLLTVSLIGNQYFRQGKYGKGNYEKAMAYYKRALQGNKSSLGRDHPATLDMVNNVAAVHTMQKDYAEAERYYEWALAGREAKLGKCHANTLDTVSNMADVHFETGHYRKAMALYKRALKGLKPALGKRHPRVLGIARNIERCRHEARRETKANLFENNRKESVRALNVFANLRGIVRRQGRKSFRRPV